MAVDETGITPTEPGLRERKKAQMRERISDLATSLFIERGYEEVRVADIAAAAGVSEKTVFNYFPTKESLVFDQFDDQLARTLRAIRDRSAGTSPTRAYIDELKSQLAGIDDRDFDDLLNTFPRFGQMIEATPALRAAWGDHRHDMVAAVAGVLADDLGVDVRDPEPMTMARALVSLTELSYDTVQHNVGRASSTADLLARIEADLERGARLLDTGLWSAAVMMDGRRSAQELLQASRAAERARRQVMAAVREARRSWRSAGGTRRLKGSGRA